MENRAQKEQQRCSALCSSWWGMTSSAAEQSETREGDSVIRAGADHLKMG